MQAGVDMSKHGGMPILAWKASRRPSGQETGGMTNMLDADTGGLLSPMHNV